MINEKDIQKAAQATAWNPVKALSDRGVRSGHAYTAGFAAVGIALASWMLSRGKDDSKAQSDRWGLFIGQWAPTFFGIGIALKAEKG